MSRVLRDARQREEEIKRHYISADHDVTDQDYYQRYLRNSAPTVKYTKPKLKRNNILQPTTPSVFQIARPASLKENRQEPDQDLYESTDHDDRPAYQYPYSSGQPMFSSRFIQSVYRQTPRHRYTQKPTDRELLTMYSQPVRLPYPVPRRDLPEYHLRKLDDYSRARDSYHQTAANYMNEGNNLDIDSEDVLLDDECQRAVESLTSVMEDDPESSNDSVPCAETNYVMIPCDINIARMLGWPIHMLQRVSQPMLERIQQESVRSLEQQQHEVPVGISNHASQPSPDSPSEPSSTSQTVEDIAAQANLSDYYHNYHDVKGTNARDPNSEIPQVKRRRCNDSSSQLHQATVTAQETKEADQANQFHQQQMQIPQQPVKLNLADQKFVSSTVNGKINNGERVKTESNVHALDKNDMKTNRMNEFKGSKELAKSNGDLMKDELCTARELDKITSQDIGQPDNEVKVACPMDSDFKVFPSSESDDELESIDTSSMSASFGHMDSESIAAYQLHNSQGSDKIL